MLPEEREEEQDVASDAGVHIVLPGTSGSGEAPDCGTTRRRAFYEHLPDLRAVVPAVLFQGASEPSGAAAEAAPAADGTDGTADLDDDLDKLTLESPAATTTRCHGRRRQAHERRRHALARSGHGNPAAVDQLATDFCYLNSRGGAQEADKGALRHAQATRPRTLLTRLAATLAPVMPDVARSSPRPSSQSCAASATRRTRCVQDAAWPSHLPASSSHAPLARLAVSHGRRHEPAAPKCHGELTKFTVVSRHDALCARASW